MCKGLFIEKSLLTLQNNFGSRQLEIDLKPNLIYFFIVSLCPKGRGHYKKINIYKNKKIYNFYKIYCKF